MCTVIILKVGGADRMSHNFVTNANNEPNHLFSQAVSPIEKKIPKPIVTRKAKKIQPLTSGAMGQILSVI